MKSVYKGIYDLIIGFDLNGKIMVISNLIIAAFLFISLLLSSCSTLYSAGKQQEPFYAGADLSVLDKYQAFGGHYKLDGKEENPLHIFKSGGYNFVRLRLFHSPNMEGPVCQSLDYVKVAALKIKKAGMKFLLDIHYSDTWAGPGHQNTPSAWMDCNLDQLVDSVYDYTHEVVNVLGEQGAAPDMIQIGNEINGGMLWPLGRIHKEGQPADYESISRMLKAGIKGVRDSRYGKKTEIMIHLARGGDFKGSKRFFDNIIAKGVEFDVIGESYYPWWHGTFDDLSDNLGNLSATYDQKIVIAETSYFWRPPYFSSLGTTSDNQPYPLTKKGQAEYMKAFYQVLKKYPKVAGFFYWFPEAVKVKKESGLKYANRSLFDEEGNALPAMHALKEFLK